MAEAKRDENNVTSVLWVSSSDPSVTIPVQINPVTGRMKIEVTWWTSPLTTKGDLYTYDTADARLGVWTDGQSLVADSSEPTGLKWNTPAWGGDMTAAVYDPTTVAWDTFDMDNMVEWTTSKILTVAERTTIWNQSGTNTGDQTSIVGISWTIAQFNTAVTDATLSTGWGTATGTNTWDQTSIVWITGTKAQFDTAVTDGDIVYVWDNITGTAANVTWTVAIANWGTWQTTQTEAFDALSPNTTKGDIIVNNGTDDIRRAVGTNWQVLIADSAESDGVKWGNDIIWKSANTDALNSATTTVNISSATAPTTWQVLTATGWTAATWQTPAWGSTDISCRVKQAVTQNIWSTLTAIIFDAETFDTDTMHDNATNNTRITFTTAGKYQINAAVTTDGNSANRIQIRLNWTTVIGAIGWANWWASTQNGSDLNTIYDFAASDYIEVLWAFTSWSFNTVIWEAGTYCTAYKLF